MLKIDVSVKSLLIRMKYFITASSRSAARTIMVDTFVGWGLWVGVGGRVQDEDFTGFSPPHIIICICLAVHYDKFFREKQSLFGCEAASGLLLLYPKHSVHVIEVRKLLRMSWNPICASQLLLRLISSIGKLRLVCCCSVCMQCHGCRNTHIMLTRRFVACSRVTRCW